MTLSGPVVAAIRDAGLDPDHVESVAAAALAEDLGGGIDVTTESIIDPATRAVADLVPRAPGVLAGIPVAMAAFDLRLDGGGSIAPLVDDGSAVRPGTPVLTVSGPARAITTAERTVLNLLCHLSGVATLTRQWVDAVAGSGAVIRDTRKTMPGLRVLEKYAVRCGGGRNHRMGLADQALIKDNHVVAAGGITAAVEAVRAAAPGIACEVECDTVAQVAEAARAGATLILLDNMGLDALAEAVAIAKAAGARTEASGGLTLAGARAVAETGVDFLAVGALTHSAPALDLGLDFR